MTASVVLFSGVDNSVVERREVTLKSARRRSQFIAAFRIVLLASMAGLAATVIFYIVSSASQPPVQIDPVVASGEERMVNPRYTGYDANGTPFELTASSAQRQRPGSSIMQLDAPRLDMTSERSPSSIVEAVRGVYDLEERTLELRGGVRFRTEDGYEFESENAIAYLDDGLVEGDRPIRGEGPIGRISALSFEIRDNGGAVAFIGDVDATLYPENTRGAIAAPGGDRAASAARGGPTFNAEGGPIHIVADITEFVPAENVNRWQGGVIVTQADARFQADHMDIFFVEDAAGARTINNIAAAGSVAYVTPRETARGESGAYDAAAERIVLRAPEDDPVVLVRGTSRATGPELVVDLPTGEATFTGGASQGSGAGRITGVLGASDLDRIDNGGETSN